MDFHPFELTLLAAGPTGSYRVLATASRGREAIETCLFDPSAQETLADLLERPTGLAELRSMGKTLFDSFFAGSVRTLLGLALGEVWGGEALGLRIVLRIEPPELTVLPWEMLYFAERELFLATSPKTTISRTLSLLAPSGSAAFPERFAALLAIPESSGLATGPETRKLEQQLGRVATVTSLTRRVTRTALRRALLEREHHILHFAGHGSFRDGEAILVLAAENGLPDPVPAAAFAELVRDRPEVRLVVLNSCEGGSRSSTAALAGAAPLLLQSGVPAVLAMQTTINNSVAARFAETLYNELVHGRESGNIETALARARSALLLDRSFDSSLALPFFASPVLYLRAPDGQLWQPAGADRAEPVRRHAERVRKSLEPSILCRIPRREARRTYLPIVLKSIRERRCRIVPVLASAGFGKSTVLGELYDLLRAEGVPWILLIDSAEVSWRPGEDLALALGRAAGGEGEPIERLAAALTRRHGHGVLLLDTLDLVLQGGLVPPLQRVLFDLGEAEVTVVFTCRDHDYDMVLTPLTIRLGQVANRIDRHFLLPFDRDEVEEAARAFVAQNPVLGHSPAGALFVTKILALAADSRPLQQITSSPLLLAMLCELFSQEGDVPRDLTVGKLYERYWEEKIEKSRRYERDAPELLEKPRLCLGIAARLLERSIERLQEAVAEADLPLERPATAGARAELLSEGVLKLQPGGRVRFFHQTFLEYAMARWLLTAAAAARREEILTLLRREDAPLHWWPVLRQFLVLVDEPELQEIAERLPVEPLAAFRTLSLAAAIRAETGLLRELLDRALALGSEHQRSLCLALESAPALDPDFAGSILSAILRQGSRDGALAATQTAAALLSLGSNPGARLRGLLAAVEERYRHFPNREERTEILVQLLQESLQVLEATLDPEGLHLLEERYRTFTDKIRCAVVRLFHKASLSVERKIRFLESILASPPDGHVEDELVDLLALRLGATGDLGTATTEERLAVLRAPFPTSWEGFYARAVARLAAGDPALLAELVRDVLAPQPVSPYRSIVVLRDAIRGGQVSLLLDLLIRRPPEQIPRARIPAVGELVREVAGSGRASPGERLSLSRWLRPLVDAWPEEALGLYAAVADAGEETWSFLVSALGGLLARGRTAVARRVVSAVPARAKGRLLQEIEHHAELDPTRTGTKWILIDLYAGTVGSSESAARHLSELALAPEKEIALAASLGLSAAAGKGPSPTLADFLPLAGSPVPGVRDRLLEGVLALQKAGHEISTESLVHLWTTLASDETLSVPQKLCELAGRFIRATGEIPAPVLEGMAGLAERVGRGELGTQMAGTLLRVLKVMAQAERPETERLLEEAMGRVLETVEVSRFSHGETEVINLMSALARMDRQVLERLLARGARFRPRNTDSLVLAIRRVEGAGSPLLSTLLAADWCPPATRQLILELRGV